MFNIFKRKYKSIDKHQNCIDTDVGKKLNDLNIIYNNLRKQIIKSMSEERALKLTNEKALELYKTADNTLKQLLEENWPKDFFKPKLITDTVFDIESLCKHLGIREDSLYLFNKTTKNPHERYINACNILPKIAEVYNEGTVLNWNNSEYKYLSYKNFYFSSAAVHSYISYCSLHCSGGLYYKSEKLAQLSYNNFKDLFEDFWQAK